MVQATTDSESVVRAYVDLWNTREVSEIPDVVSESFVMYDPAAPGEDVVPGPEGEVHGRDGLEAFMNLVETSVPGFYVDVSELLSSEDTVMYEAEITLSRVSGHRGLVPPDVAPSFRSMSRLHVEDGLVDEHRAYFDHLSTGGDFGFNRE